MSTEKINKSIEIMIGSAYVRYSTLSRLISASYAGSNCTKLNIFIDLNYVLKKLYVIDAFKYNSKEVYDMTAYIVNMCGHYREFFRNIGVITNFYLIYGLNCPSMNENFVKGYNSQFVNEYNNKTDITEIIETNMKLLQILCQYLPRIYFFNIGRNEVSAMIDYIITKLNPSASGIENIVITKDPLSLQLVPLHNARILVPIKSKGNDESILIDNSNLWYYFCTFFKSSKVPEKFIPTSFISNIMAMTGVNKRGMYAVFNTSKSFKIIQSGIDIGIINPNEFYDQEKLNTAFLAMDIGTNLLELDMRYKAISARYQSTYILLMEKPEFKYLRLIDLEDPKSVQMIASKYFINCPINLEYL